VNEILLYVVGVLVLILGLMLSVGLHEFGHLIPAKLFGVRVPHWAIGFGPKLYAKKIGETEYSIRAIPLGGFITLIGMYPPAKPGKDDSKRWFSDTITSARNAHKEHEQPGDENRKFYQLSAWKRIIVMFGGPVTNLILGVTLITVALSGFGIDQRVNVFEKVVACEEQMLDSTAVCGPQSVATPAHLAKIQSGDKLIAVDGKQVSLTEDALAPIVQLPLTTHTVTVERAGKKFDLSVTAANTKLPYLDSTGNIALNQDGTQALKARPYIGVQFGHQRVAAPVEQSIGRAFAMTGETLGMIVQFPQQVYASISALFTGEERNPTGAVSIIGVGQAAGSITANADSTLADRIYLNLFLIGSLNLALFAFNMIPLPPLDGGHIAGGIYEYLKRGLFRLLGKKDPGYADTALLAPLATAMFFVLLAAGLAMMIVDLVNPLKF
jgi:membrane-associated protease RseP (regulator of RpoE activity)